MKINNRQQFLVILAIVAVTLLVGDRLVLGPLVQSYKNRSAKIKDLRKSVTVGTLLVQREKSLRDRWNLMQQNALPQNTSSAEQQVLKAFDRWSEESRISISSIKPQWKTLEDDYTTLECRVDASGNITALTRFLYELEKDPLAIRVDSVEISSRDNDGQQLALGLQVSALLLNEKKP